MDGRADVMSACWAELVQQSVNPGLDSVPCRTGPGGDEPFFLQEEGPLTKEERKNKFNCQVGNREGGEGKKHAHLVSSPFRMELGS